MPLNQLRPSCTHAVHVLFDYDFKKTAECIHIVQQMLLLFVCGKADGWHKNNNKIIINYFPAAASSRKEKLAVLSGSVSMSENCTAMPPTIHDRESSKSPSGSHTIEDILGTKGNASQPPSSRSAMYNGSGSDSSSDSSSNSASEGESSPSFPVDNSANSRQQQLMQMASLAGGSPQQQQGNIAPGKVHFSVCLMIGLLFCRASCIASTSS